MVQNNSEFPILAISHLFQFFPTKSGINSYRTSNLGCSGPFPIFPKLFGMLNFGHLTLFPIFSHKVVQNYLECSILLSPHFPQSFPTKVVQNYLECSILLSSHFFQSFPTKVVQNYLECSILLISHFFQSFPTKVVQNDLEHPVLVI